MHTLRHRVDKSQVFGSGAPASPAEQPIHQQESDWLQGSGSPYTASDATVRVPLPIYPRQRLSVPAHMDLFCCHPASPRPSLTSVFSPPRSLSLGFCTSFLPEAPSLFPFHPPSHRLGSKTGAGSWEAINQQKVGIRALLQNKTTADSFTHGARQWPRSSTLTDQGDISVESE